MNTPYPQKEQDPTPEQRTEPNLVCTWGKEIFEEYKEAEGVIPYRDFVKTTFAYSHLVHSEYINSILDILHVTIGIAGEYIELQNELENHILIKLNLSSLHNVPLYNERDLEKAYFKAQKELGDLCYYTYMAANLVNMSLPRVNPLFNQGDEKAIENFVDAIKKQIFYDLEIDLFHHILAVWGQLCYIAETVFNKPIEFFVLQNKVKLMKRYPLGKFRSEDAATKKDETQTTQHKTTIQEETNRILKEIKDKTT